LNFSDVDYLSGETKLLVIEFFAIYSMSGAVYLKPSSSFASNSTYSSSILFSMVPLLSWFEVIAIDEYSSVAFLDSF
jgi:hypothetical protein